MMEMKAGRRPKWILLTLAAGLTISGAALAARMGVGNQTGQASPPLTSAAQKRIEIRGVQRALDAKGYHAGPADGIFGGKTARAVSNFQRDHNETVTGHINMPTLVALGIANQEAPGGQQAGTSSNTQIGTQPGAGIPSGSAGSGESGPGGGTNPDPLGGGY